MDGTPDTRRSLILKLRDPADAASWEEFVTLYEPLIYRLARRKGLQDADARDVCQEVFRAVMGSVDRWEPGRGSFRGWLSRIARNLLINFLTRRQDWPPWDRAAILELPDARTPDDVAAAALFESEYRQRVFDWAAGEVRGEFTPPTWEAFWKTAVEGRPPAAVSAELGLTVGAVYIAKSRVLARLKRRIAQMGNEGTAIIGEEGHASPSDSL